MDGNKQLPQNVLLFGTVILFQERKFTQPVPEIRDSIKLIMFTAKFRAGVKRFL